MDFSGLYRAIMIEMGMIALVGAVLGGGFVAFLFWVF